jgi:hypothetical protein
LHLIIRVVIGFLLFVVIFDGDNFIYLVIVFKRDFVIILIVIFNGYFSNFFDCVID